MANATEPMADYAFWQTIVGGFGLAALVVSLCYTAKATRAAALATKAAIRANAISRDTAKKELRAYVSLAPAGVKFDEMGRPIIVTAQKNNGQTPALLTRAFAVPDELPYPLPEAVNKIETLGFAI